MSVSNGLHPHRGNISSFRPTPKYSPKFLSSSDDATEDEDDGDCGSAAHDTYYHPISAFDGGSDPNSDSDVASGGIVEAVSPIRSNGGALFHLQDPDPSFLFLDAESGISALDLNGGGDAVGGSSGGLVQEVEDEEADEESVRQREVSISRAFREDERRRSSPLTPENAARVLDAMRGVAFQGVPPDWAERVPEDQWVDRLRRMRGSFASMRRSSVMLVNTLHHYTELENSQNDYLDYLFLGSFASTQRLGTVCSHGCMHHHHHSGTAGSSDTLNFADVPLAIWTTAAFRGCITTFVMLFLSRE
ncbi:hypothetical protein BHE74_00053623 [Ensete ventricosum]|nr:hypothetical protein BHE74_00053623 [Ensete ventricosum]